MSNIKKCPCCNKIPTVYIDETRTPNCFVLRCSDTNCNFPYAVGNEDKERAILIWNGNIEHYMKKAENEQTTD